MQLSNEEKYEIAQFESEALKKNIDEGRIKSDGILETLRVKYPTPTPTSTSTPI